MDVVATKDTVKVALQCELHKGRIGNKAVQEVHAAASYIDADLAAVVAPGEYTKAARELAGKLGVLLHHDQLAAIDDLIA